MGLPGLESPTHLLLILVVILLLFGARRLPELGRSLGKGINEFKAGLNSKDEPAEEERAEAVEGKRDEEADPEAADGHRREEAAHAEAPRSSKQQ